MSPWRKPAEHCAWRFARPPARRVKVSKWYWPIPVPGVPEKLLEEIFNPFVTTKKTGVGLGLSIVSKIVDGHQGFIHVENGPQGGAVFTLFFPMEEVAEAHELQTGT